MHPDNRYGWGLVAREMTESEAEWLAERLVFESRAMPVRKEA